MTLSTVAFLRRALLLFAAVILCTAAYAADTLPLQKMGRLGVAWSPQGGLRVSVDDIPIVRTSTLYIVSPQWTPILFNTPIEKWTIAPWSDLPSGAKTATAASENPNCKLTYTFTLQSDNILVVHLNCRLTHDIPAHIEYAAGYLSGNILQGASLATDNGIISTISNAFPDAYRSQEQNRIGWGSKSWQFDTRLGKLSVNYDGTNTPTLFDARGDGQSWAQKFPVFWLGIGSPTVPVPFSPSGTDYTFRFTIADAPAKNSAPDIVATPIITPSANTVEPVVPQTPLIIPRPKEIAVTHIPFRVTDKTEIVVPDDVTDKDKQGAYILQSELQTRWGKTVPVVREKNIGDSDSLILLGRPVFSQRFETDLSKVRAGLPTQPEGYRVIVTPNRVVGIGYLGSGAFYAAQTIIQLLTNDANGVIIQGCKIRDWPTLRYRGVHLFHGKDALPFHKKLIDRLFSRFKMNNLVLQCERTKWDAIDKSIVEPWWSTKAGLRRESEFAIRRNIRVVPLIEAYGHMEWLLATKKYRGLSEDPKVPYALNIGDVRAVGLMEKIIAEAADLFPASYFHIGMDEVTMRGRFPNPERGHGKTAAELFVSATNHWQSFLKKRDKTTIMWADQAMHPSEIEPSFGTAKSPTEAVGIRAALNKDIVMMDWQYTPYEKYPSLGKLKSAGFENLIAATWFGADNIQQFSKAAAKADIDGCLQTTWAGYESKESILDTDERRQFIAMIWAADYFWNGGTGPAPNNLPYNATDVFRKLMETPHLQTQTVQSGATYDLSQFGTMTPTDAAVDVTVPTETPRLLDGALYTISTNSILLNGKLNDSRQSYANRCIIAVNRKASELRFAIAATHRTDTGTKIGIITVKRAGNRDAIVDLIYGKNIVASDDPNGNMPLLWKGKTADGRPMSIHRLIWANHVPTVPIESITITSENGESAPILIAVTSID